MKYRRLELTKLDEYQDKTPEKRDGLKEYFHLSGEKAII